MLIDSFLDFNSIFISILAGVVISLIYSMFKAFRTIFRCGTTSIIIQDLFFSIIASLLTFIILLVRVKGEIRWFILFFELLGFVLFKILVSSKIEFILIKAIKFLIKYVFKPIFALYELIIIKINLVFDNFISKISKIT